MITKHRKVIWTREKIISMWRRLDAPARPAGKRRVK